MIDSDGIPHLPKLGQGLNLLFIETYWSYPGAIFILIMTSLFKNNDIQKLSINNISLNNRVVVGPMCQYSAINSLPSDWHFNHLKKLSQLFAGALWLKVSFFLQKNQVLQKKI